MRSCPKCKTSSYNNKNFALLINECGHSLCNNCVDNLFVRNSGPCPTCAKTLKKKDFWAQRFDDPIVEKEVHFRQKLRKIFNLKEEDFETLRQYNDYLEKIEYLVFNLVDDSDVTETWAEVEKFRLENEELIAQNRKKRSLDEQWIESELADEARFRNRLADYEKLDVELEETGAKVDEAQALIDELKSSDLPAELILDQKRKRQIELKLQEREERRKRLKTAPKPRDRFVPSAVGQTFTYEPVVLEWNGPPVPDIDELESLGYLKHMRASTPEQLAGGYEHKLGCMRALLEARCDIYGDE